MRKLIICASAILVMISLLFPACSNNSQESWDAINQGIDELGLQLADLKGDLTSIINNMAAIQSSLDHAANDATNDDILAAISEVQNKIDTTLLNELSDIQIDLESVQNHNDSVEDDLGKIQTRIDGLRSDISKLRDEVKDILNDILVLQDDVKGIVEDISAIGSDTDNIIAALLTIQTAIDNIDEKLTNLQVDVTDIKNELPNIVKWKASREVWYLREAESMY